MTWENNYFLLRLSLNPGASVSAAPAFLPEGSALNEHPLSPLGGRAPAGREVPLGHC